MCRACLTRTLHTYICTNNIVLCVQYIGMYTYYCINYVFFMYVRTVCRLLHYVYVVYILYIYYNFIYCLQGVTMCTKHILWYCLQGVTMCTKHILCVQFAGCYNVY